MKNAFHQAKKGLLQDIENANGINKKNQLTSSQTTEAKTTKSVGTKVKW